MKIIKKCIISIGYILFFCIYFYVVFINFFNNAAINSTSIEIIKLLIWAAIFAAFLPGLICWQDYRIRKLEDQIGSHEDSSSSREA